MKVYEHIHWRIATRYCLTEPSTDMPMGVLLPVGWIEFEVMR